MKKFKKWLLSKNLNQMVQEICAILLGLGIGLYAYESKMALVPMKWQVERGVASDIKKEAPRDQKGGFFKKIPVVRDFWNDTGAERYFQHLKKYTQKIKDLGVKGNLKNKLESLIQKGVEPVPKKWTKTENRPYLIVALLVIVCAFVIKVLIHMKLLNFDHLKIRLITKQTKVKKRLRVDWNSVFQEISTLGLSAIGGIYLMPAVEGIIQEEAVTLPYPMIGISLFLFSIALKAAIYSCFLDVNSWAQERRAGRKGDLFSLRRFKSFSQSYNWNRFAQEVTALILGIGLGFYVYDSNLALLPLKWKMDKQVAKDISKEAPPPKKEKEGFFGRIGKAFKKAPVVKEFWKKTPLDRYISNLDKYKKTLEDFKIGGNLKNKLDRLMRNGVEPVPQKWKKKENLPYLIVLLALFIASFVIKCMIYFSWLDFNKLIRKRYQKNPQEVEWDLMAQEFSTIVISALVGLYTEPTLDYFTGKQDTTFPYETLGPILLVSLILLKILMHLEIIAIKNWSARFRVWVRRIKQKYKPISKKKTTRKPPIRRH